MANFWWDNVECKRKIHWLSWEKMCLSKEDGGMGFRDLECFNQALLAKQAWKLLHFEECLMARVLKGKYYAGKNFLKVQEGKKVSYAWKSIIFGRELLIKQLKISVGNGRNLKVWTEPWVEDGEGVCRPPLRRQIFFDVNLMVSEVIDHQKRRWNTSKLEELFVPSDVRILEQNQPSVSEKDSWVWNQSRSGVYSVKTGYEIAFSEKKMSLLRPQIETPSLNPLKAQVWNLQAPSKIKVFLWKVLSGAVSVFDALKSRGMRCDSGCQTCGMEGESINHVLFSCTLARKIWAMSGFPSPMGGFDESSVFANVNYLLQTWRNKEEMKEITKVFPWILWYLWKNRNSLLFEGFLYDEEQMCNKAREEANLWFLAHEVEQRISDGKRRPLSSHTNDWIAPPRQFLKCNIGMRWSKKKMETGAAWVLRDSGGTVLLHSRRSFAGVWSKDEAYFISLAWAIESMISHKCRRVYFSLEGSLLVNAINRPKAWPSFKFKVLEIRRLLGELLEWRVMLESVSANSAARLIANSVIGGDRFQSYVARGHPRWLSDFFGDRRDRNAIV